LGERRDLTSIGTRSVGGSVVLIDCSHYKSLIEPARLCRHLVNSRISFMSSIAIAFGALLTVLGVGLFGLSAGQAPTALIPAGFGLFLIICGVIARNEASRKHAMHFAALLGLVGCVAPLFMVIKKYATTTEFNPLSGGGQLAMSALCGIFLALCVKSFIDARKARKQAEAGQ
jgi:hypothetical protein